MNNWLSTTRRIWDFFRHWAMPMLTAVSGSERGKWDTVRVRLGGVLLIGLGGLIASISVPTEIILRICNVPMKAYLKACGVTVRD